MITSLHIKFTIINSINYQTYHTRGLKEKGSSQELQKILLVKIQCPLMINNLSELGLEVDFLTK